MILEEQKLIEEFRKYIKLNYDGLDGTSLGISEPEMKIFDIASQFISLAYHSGKLAGFEECEKIMEEICKIPEGSNVPILDGLSFATFGKFKSLVEEAKKKL